MSLDLIAEKQMPNQPPAADELDLDAMEANWKKFDNCKDPKCTTARKCSECSRFMEWCAVEYLPHLIAEVRKLRKALEFYAWPNNYIYWPVESESAIYRDQGTLAREALGEK